MLYLTDTGRRWDGFDVSVRDKVNLANSFQQSAFSHLKFRRTQDIIDAAEADVLPDRIMITVHPQRWSNSFSP